MQQELDVQGLGTDNASGTGLSRTTIWWS
jgi:hypothetical protein